jgi:hypothetical protein
MMFRQFFLIQLFVAVLGVIACGTTAQSVSNNQDLAGGNSGGNSSQQIVNRSTTGYQDLLGKNLEDHVELTDFIAQYCELWELLYLCKSKGIELHMGGMNGTVLAIILFAQGADGYSQYQGELPYGLSWSDTRAEVEQKLGSGKSVGQGNLPYSVLYEDLGLQVNYDTPSTEDMSARIHHLVVK